MHSKLFSESHNRGAWRESKSHYPFFRILLDMNLKTWGPDTSVTDSTRDWLPCCGNAGLTAKPLVADTACFDVLTFLDEDERGALGTAQDFESNLQNEFALY